MNKGLRKRKAVLRKKVVQHHLFYDYDGLTHKQVGITVPIYNTEHYITTLLQRRGKYISKGFIQALRHWILIQEIKGTPVDLSPNITNTIAKTIEIAEMEPIGATPHESPASNSQ